MSGSPPLAKLALAGLAVAALGPLPAHGTEGPSPSRVECSADNPEDCLDGVGAGVVSGDAQQVVAGRVARAGEVAEEDETGTVSFRRGGGLAAGGPFTAWGVWGSLGYSDFEGEPVFGAAITPYEGDLFNALAGVDAAIGEHFVLGLAFGYEDADTDTLYNAGNLETTGFTVAPYALLVVNRHLSFDAAGGIAFLDNEQRRLLPLAGGPVARADFDSERWFVAGNANLLYTSGAWVLGARLGVLHTEETQDGYTETVSTGGTARTVAERDLDLTQLLVSADVGYALGALEPFVRVTYANDLSREDGQGVGGLPGGNVRTDFDDDEWRLGGGVRFFAATGLSGSLEVETETGREDFENLTVLATVRAEF